VTRDHVIVFAVLAVVVVLAVQNGSINSGTFLLVAAAIPSIILHEVSHGVVALGFGDDTAKRAGRITLNPVRHIDPFGTIILPALLAVAGLAVFGYAKPVPINASRMRNPRDDAVVVSLAGPVTNILLALAAGVWLRAQHVRFLSLVSGPWAGRIPYALGYINVILAVFNLIPIPPLDGSSVVGRFIPAGWRHGWGQMQRYGLAILVVFLLVGRSIATTYLFNPALNLWYRFVGV
jgi:Zn-dependent protease